MIIFYRTGYKKIKKKKKREKERRRGVKDVVSRMGGYIPSPPCSATAIQMMDEQDCGDDHRDLIVMEIIFSGSMHQHRLSSSWGLC